MRCRQDTEPATSSQALAVGAPMRPFVTGEDETMEHEEPESKRLRTVAGLPVCSLLLLVDEIPVSYVATHEIDERPVYDHKTGELLGKGWSTDWLRGNAQTSTVRTCADRVGSRQKVRCQWLEQMKEGADGPLVRSRLVAMEGPWNPI